MKRFKVLALAAVCGGVLLTYALFLRFTSTSGDAAEPSPSLPTRDARFLEAAREPPRPEEPPPPPVDRPPLRYEDLVPPPPAPPPPPAARDESLDALEQASHLTALRLDAPPPPEPSRGPTARVPRRAIVAGTLIEAQLHQPLRTDQPGTIVAQSLRPVYDLYGRIVLPAGTRFLGSIAASQVYDAGAELHWHRLITPDGRSLELEVNAESTDHDGGSVNGRRRTHRGQKARAILVTALTTAAVEAARGDRTTVDIGAAAGTEAVSGTEALVSRWAQRALARPPTIHLDAGATLYIRVVTDLSL